MCGRGRGRGREFRFSDLRLPLHLDQVDLAIGRGTPVEDRHDARGLTRADQRARGCDHCRGINQNQVNRTIVAPTNGRDCDHRNALQGNIQRVGRNRQIEACLKRFNIDPIGKLGPAPLDQFFHNQRVVSVSRSGEIDAAFVRSSVVGGGDLRRIGL